MKRGISLLACLALSLGCSAPDEGPRDVIADGYSLPPGFTSLQATGPRNAEGQRIEGILHDATSGTTVRYTMARGSKWDVAPGEPIHPVDVCVRDASTGEVLLMPHVFADRSLIEGCGGEDDDDAHDEGDQGHANANSAEMQRKRDAALAGLAALRSVHFKAEYEPERETLVDDSIPPAAFAVPQGGRVVKDDASGRVVQFDEPKER